MSPKKHIASKCKQVGVFVFFFLSCFLIAIPFIDASAQDNRYLETTGSLTHDSSTGDQEDNSRSNYSEERAYHFSVRSKRSVVHHSKAPGIYYFSSNNMDDLASGHCFASSSFAVRPAYYIFLSLYMLF